VTISSSQSAMRVPRKQIRQIIDLLAREESVRIADVDVAIVDDDQMAELNARHLSHRGTTDVLSFDLSDSVRPGLSVQLIISGPEAARQGPIHGETKTRELLRYVVHGLLHQLGYEDQSVRGAARTHAREDEILALHRARRQAGR
jgi:rRNA maturation RNase YbeY